jgi:uncharacterized membrane protein
MTYLRTHIKTNKVRGLSLKLVSAFVCVCCVLCVVCFVCVCCVVLCCVVLCCVVLCCVVLCFVCVCVSLPRTYVCTSSESKLFFSSYYWKCFNGAFFDTSAFKCLLRISLGLFQPTVGLIHKITN